jgi:hypothetical protein
MASGDRHVYRAHYTHPATGQTATHDFHVSDDVHKQHGDNGNGTLKNISYMVSIAANAIPAKNAVVKGIQYLRKVLK